MHKTIKYILDTCNISQSFRKRLRRMYHSKFLYFLSTSQKPLSNYYGYDRGTPLDRYFIEAFLQKYQGDIKGVCLELYDNTYTKKYGGNNVSKSDILDIVADNENATIIDDLRNLKKIEDNTYDCLILTQVFQFIDDIDSAIAECYRITKTGGVLLITLPAISRADCSSGAMGDFWRFTVASAKYLFSKKFDSNKIHVGYYGNVRSSTYFYNGLSIEDSPKSILQYNDIDFPTIITIKIIK